MAWYEIPLSGSDEQFTVSILGVSYQITVVYRGSPYNTWILDLSLSSGGDLVLGIPLITGTDLLSPFSAALGLGFSLFVSSDADPTAVPTESTLGTTSHLYVRTN